MALNILIIRMSAIGDVIHTLPAVFLLKTCLPEAHISWVVQKKTADLLIGQPFLDHVWVVNNQFLMPRNFFETGRIIKEIRAHSWDAIIDFQGLIKTSIFYACLSGKKYGFAPPEAREYPSTWFTQVHHRPQYTHIIQKNLGLASQVATDLGAQPWCPSLDELHKQCRLTVPAEKQQTVHDWLTAKKLQKFIVFCPNTTWPSKHWPAGHWAQCLQLITQNLAGRQEQTGVIIVGAPFGQPAATLARYQEDHNLHIPVTPAWDLLTTAFLISHASLVIAPDTGLLHLADLLGTPTIGIFGPTNKEKHGPFLTVGNRKTTIQVQCPHVYKKTHGKNNIEKCMDALDPTTVARQVLQYLDKKQSIFLN